MQTKMLLKLAVFVILVDNVFARIEFDCDPYGAIFVKNPKPSKLLFANAVDYQLLGNSSFDESSFVCTTYISRNHPTVIIEPNAAGYCGKGRPILLTLSNVSVDATLIVSMPYKENYIVRCLDIPNTGITVNVTQEVHATSGPSADDIAPDYDIEDIGQVANFTNKVISRLYKCCEFDDETPQQTTALVGENLLWTLDVYNDYYLLPLICVAHAGQNITGSPSTILIEEGCSADRRLVTYRSTIPNWTARQRRMYIMNLYAFHFYNSHYITIVCHVKVCPAAGQRHCQWSCNDRKRRSLEPEALTSSRDDKMITTVQTMRILGYLNTGNTHDYISYPWMLLSALALRYFY